MHISAALQTRLQYVAFVNLQKFCSNSFSSLSSCLQQSPALCPPCSSQQWTNSLLSSKHLASESVPLMALQGKGSPQTRPVPSRRNTTQWHPQLKQIPSVIVSQGKKKITTTTFLIGFPNGKKHTLLHFPNVKTRTLLNLAPSVLSEFDIVLLLCQKESYPFWSTANPFLAKTKHLSNCDKYIGTFPKESVNEMPYFFWKEALQPCRLLKTWTSIPFCLLILKSMVPLNQTE